MLQRGGQVSAVPTPTSTAGGPRRHFLWEGTGAAGDVTDSESSAVSKRIVH